MQITEWSISQLFIPEVDSDSGFWYNDKMSAMLIGSESCLVQLSAVLQFNLPEIIESWTGLGFKEPWR